MNYHNELTDSEWIERILEWSDTNPAFDTHFIESLQDAIDEYGDLTWSQSRALHNIIEGYRIKPTKDG